MPLKLSAPTELLWALIGLILTIGGTFLEGFILNAPWDWSRHGLQAYAIGVTFQIGAVLFVGFLGGRNAAAISQIAYVLIGLTWRDVFGQGGGYDYIHHPAFGYLLGFIPGAWLCGHLAFRLPSRLESIAFSGLAGLVAIHAIGLTYLLIGFAVDWVQSPLSLWQAILTYSVYPIPAQLAIVCAATVLAFGLRLLLFY